MKDHTFNARNDDMRARQQSRAPANTTDASALADATGLAIGAASPKPRATNAKKGAKKNASDVTANGTAPGPTVADGANALAELFDRAEREGKQVAKKKIASLAKTIDAAIAADKIAPDFNPLAGAGAASTDLLKAAAKKSRAKSETPATKPAKVDWLDTGLERTGSLTVDQLARAWIAHLEAGGKTTASTIASYANDLKTAIAFFGADLCVRSIPKFGGGPNTPSKAGVNEFNECDAVMKLKSGAPKAQPTILKMRRAFRMALEWARENGIQEG